MRSTRIASAAAAAAGKAIEVRLEIVRVRNFCEFYLSPSSQHVGGHRPDPLGSAKQ